MQFKSLEDKCSYYRSLTDYKLLPNSYVLVLVDGRSFSHMIKNKFQKPFDDEFIRMMNETAQYVCKNVQGCKFAYVQSDEISFVLTDFDTPTTGSFYNNRLCKMQSIIASLTTSKFNQLMTAYKFDKMVDEYGNSPKLSGNEVARLIGNMQEYQFDCKCWNVPSINDVFAWFLYRQIDCIRNSKQQTAQTYLPHSALMNKGTDEQISLLISEKGIDWNEFDDDKKYGRFIYKEEVAMTNPDNNETFTRYKWTVHPGFPLMTDYGRRKFLDIDAIPSFI